MMSLGEVMPRSANLLDLGQSEPFGEAQAIKVEKY